MTVCRRRLPLMLALWWVGGFLTLFWSLAPGNTLVQAIWETTFLAAFVAGRTRIAFWALSLALLVQGLADSLVLNAFGLESYISGSVHYVAGAQALVLVPLTLSRTVSPASIAMRSLSAGVLLLSTYMVLASGARAVYLPFAIVVILFTARHVIGAKKNRWAPVLVLATVLGIIALADQVIPGQPVATALGRKASVEVQVASAGESGVLTQRLRFWSQALDMTVQHPLGTGIGSYRAVTHAFQKYPMLWASSPHNYFLETAATGGWLRLLLLLAVLVTPLWRAWRSSSWPMALAAGGIWLTLAFDVTASHASVMAYAFFVLGATFESEPLPHRRFDRHRWESRAAKSIQGTVIVLSAVAVAWWYLPCKGEACAVQRYLGVDFKAIPALETASAEARGTILSRLRVLYPESLWVLQVTEKYASSPDERLSLAREVAQRFPYQHPENYLTWADAALAVGDSSQARTALTTGLEYFGPGRYPYGEARMTPDRYDEWLSTAESMLATLPGPSNADPSTPRSP